MFRQLQNNESGMVLIMVVMAVVAMMVFSIGVVSRGVSQTKSSESQISRIKVEQLAIGAYAKAYSDYAAGGVAPTNLSITMDNRTYVANVVNNGPGGINNTNSISVTATF
jgi:hypothetical protein